MSSPQSPAAKSIIVRPGGAAPRARTAQGEAKKAVDVHAIADDLRCDCGRLLAKVVPGGLEIRCTRCKASHVLAWSQVEGARELLGDAAVLEARADRR